MRSQERTDDSGSYVLVVTKGDRDMGQLKLTLQGFQRWGPIGCTAVDSQVSSLEKLQVDPQKPWRQGLLDLRTQGFGFHAPLGPWLLH